MTNTCIKIHVIYFSLNRACTVAAFLYVHVHACNILLPSVVRSEMAVIFPACFPCFCLQFDLAGKNDELDALRQQHALLKKMLEQQEEVHIVHKMVLG